MSNPYFITGPALISFSGGRTSAYMLKHILDAHGGTLPDDVIVAFCNTGKEREETLRFVHDCATNWNVRVRWLEYRAGPERFEEVGFNSASRNGEPFAALIAKRKLLPNGVTRFCTQELKIRVLRDFLKSLGWTAWLNVIGLRYDEGHRVLRALDANETRNERWKNFMPMSKAKATKRDVMAFWAAQPFDLRLKSYEGNCDLCFLKAKAKLLALIRENPGMADWWIDQEASITTQGRGARFVTEYSYASLADQVDRQGFLFEDDGEEFDAECGLICSGEAA